MSTDRPIPLRRRRRTVSGPLTAARVTINLDAALAERLEALSERYATARGTIARDALDAGLKTVTERLRRAARSEARGASK